MCNKTLDNFGLQRPNRNNELNVIIARELNYDVDALTENLTVNLPLKRFQN